MGESAWSPLPGEGGEELLAGGLGDRRCGSVPPERFLCGRYDVRVGVDLIGRADHPVDLPERWRVLYGYVRRHRRALLPGGLLSPFYYGLAPPLVAGR